MPRPIEDSSNRDVTGAQFGKTTQDHNSNLGDQSTSGNARSSNSDLAGVWNGADDDLELVHLSSRYEIKGTPGRGGLVPALEAYVTLTSTDDNTRIPAEEIRSKGSKQVVQVVNELPQQYESYEYTSSSKIPWYAIAVAGCVVAAVAASFNKPKGATPQQVGVAVNPPSAPVTVAKADFLYGQRYYDGEGVEQNFAEAVVWFRKAAEQGDKTAQNNLGVCYYEGKGVKQDYTEAAKWIRMAADQGIAAAQSNLGACYSDGRGVKQDDAEAVKWFRKAAEQGDVDAQCLLGIYYSYGKGVEQNNTEALRWCRKAAEQGSKPAMEALKELER